MFLSQSKEKTEQSFLKSTENNQEEHVDFGSTLLVSLSPLNMGKPVLLAFLIC